jgi:hypothetical protein
MGCDRRLRGGPLQGASDEGLGRSTYSRYRNTPLL